MSVSAELLLPHAASLRSSPCEREAEPKTSTGNILFSVHQFSESTTFLLALKSFFSSLLSMASAVKLKDRSFLLPLFVSLSHALSLSLLSFSLARSLSLSSFFRSFFSLSIYFILWRAEIFASIIQSAANGQNVVLCAREGGKILHDWKVNLRKQRIFPEETPFFAPSTQETEKLNAYCPAIL